MLTGAETQDILCIVAACCNDPKASLKMVCNVIPFAMSFQFQAYEQVRKQ